MNKFVIFASSLLLTTSALAHELTCPPISMIRDKVRLERGAMLSNKLDWVLASNVFKHSDADWNVLYFSYIQSTDPKTAVLYGQDMFDHSVLMTPHISAHEGDIMECRYTCEGMQYQVYAVTPANFGFKKLHS